MKMLVLGLIGLIAGFQSELPVERPYMSGDEWLAGDSLKYVIYWSAPSDSVASGAEDSTFFNITASKPYQFYGGTVTIPVGTVSRRKYGPARHADSLKLAKPTAAGDSVSFTITLFTQCRKGDCNIPSSGAWVYRKSWAPPPQAPQIRADSF